MAAKFDLAIVGGGLAGGLIALALRTRRPELRLALFEQGARLGGNHTWSFHDTDLSPADRDWLAPFIEFRWTTQQVRFPAHQRHLATGYNSITAERFDNVVRAALSDAVHRETTVTQLTPTTLRTAGGAEFEAGAVIDCRGDFRSAHIALGFQKFIGQVCRLFTPHGLDAPVIMDATVAQEDGYRFIYVLPFDARTVLIEDTRYSDRPDTVVADFNDGIQTYASARGWRIEATLRRESGVLPIALGGDIAAFWREVPSCVAGEVARGGMRAALFHPLTGYSLPDAVALAKLIAASPDLSAPALYQLTRGHSVAQWRARGFYRLLTRMLFRAAAPAERYRVLERFYRLPQGVIERLYAGVSTIPDKLRILSGKPPVPVHKALAVLRETSVYVSPD